MRIPSTVYNAGINADGTRAESIVKGDENRKIDGQRENGVQRDPLETRVNVSKQARQLATAHAIDLAKVVRFRAALDSGEFRVDARAIAQRIVTG